MELPPERRRELADLVRAHGYERREEAFRLSSGGWSRDYIDAKHAVDRGATLRLACEAIIELVDVAFDAVGGPTMGADALSAGVSLLSGARWFSVRKEAKGHGRGSWVEGTRLEPGDRVLMLEDVTSTGGSLLRAVDRIEELGATTVAASALLDRSPVVGDRFAERSIVWQPLLSWEDIGIEPL